MQEILHYYPLLKGKKGEYRALKECSPVIKNGMSPVIELVDYEPIPLPPDKLAKRKKPPRTYDDHLMDDIKDIIAAWGDAETPIYIDTHLVPDVKLAGKVDRIFSALDAAGITAIPVVHTSYSKQMTREYKAVIDKYDVGYCLRLCAADIDDDGLNVTIKSIVAIYGLSPTDIDLLLDNGYVDDSQVNRTAKLLEAAINALPNLADWRSLVLAAAAFPVDLSNQKPDTTKRVQRNDWVLWQILIKKVLKRTPNYGDYAIAHPDIRDIGPVIPNMSASLRYTADSEYIIVKGKGVKHNGFGQTHDLAIQIVGLSEYSGESFSPGDEWIKRCSVKATTSGNATTWRQAGTSHHLYKVIDQLATLFAALKAA